MAVHHRAGDYLPQMPRLLAIDARLREGQKPSHSRLARDFGVSVRTIQRDMDHLRFTLDAPLEYDPSKRGWFYTERTFFLPSVLVGAEDLLALLLIRQAIEQYSGTPYAEAARRAFDLIERALPERERLGAEWVKSRVVFTDFPQAEIRKEVWHAVLESLSSARTLTISYAKPGSRTVDRKVDPYGLIVSEGNWYLYTYSHERQARRTFLLARIRDAKVGSERFEIPSDFSLADYTRSGVAGLQADDEPARTVRITFSKKASRLAVERKLHPDQRETWDRHGHLTIELVARAPFKLKRRIAQFGEGVEKVAWARGAAWRADLPEGQSAVSTRSRRPAR
jgi:predicted DNA-binding transcriptional regulator YafY